MIVRSIISYFFICYYFLKHNRLIYYISIYIYICIFNEMHKFKIASTFYAVSHVVGVKCRNHFELVHFIYPCRPRRAPPPPPPPTPRAAPAPLAAPAAPTAIMNQYYLYIYLFKIISSFLFFYSFFVFHVA